MDNYIDPNGISQRIGRSAGNYAEARYRADLAKAKADTILDTIMAGNLLEGMAIEKAKTLARIEPRYIEARDVAIEESRKAGLAKAEERQHEIWWEATRSLESTKRKEMGFG